MANLLPANLFNVAGRTVLITGAGKSPAKYTWIRSEQYFSGSGIGRTLAKGFAVNGCSTILVDMNGMGLA